MRRVTIVAAAVVSALAAAPDARTQDDEKKTHDDEKDKKAPPVPLYTNADLERVSPYRDQTGALSTPAATSWSAAGEGGGEARPARRTEDYWRREAGRLRDRLRRLTDQAEDLRARIEERRRRPGVRPYSDPQVEAWERRRQALEERKREEESRFEERARRAGALPGWLR